MGNHPRFRDRYTGNISGLTGPTGDYMISQLPEDTYSVTVSASGYLSRERDVDLPVGDVVKLDFQLQPEGVSNPDADVNADGVVDAADVQLVINKALGTDVSRNCDINGDGIVTAVDVQLAINAALGL